jgi:hypothetical protein
MMVAGIVGIDVIVADTESGDDLELRKPRERLAVAPHRIVSDRDAADFLGDRRVQPFEITGGLKRMQGELIGKAVVDDRLARPVNQQIDLLGDIPAHH